MLFEMFIPESVDTDFQLRWATPLRNWTSLSTAMFENRPSRKELGNLVRMELEGRNREHILIRLVARLGMELHDELKKEMLNYIRGL